MNHADTMLERIDAIIEAGDGPAALAILRELRAAAERTRAARLAVVGARMRDAGLELELAIAQDRCLTRRPSCWGA